MPYCVWAASDTMLWVQPQRPDLPLDAEAERSIGRYFLDKVLRVPAPSPN